jgi:hypothetical protein
MMFWTLFLNAAGTRSDMLSILAIRWPCSKALADRKRDSSFGAGVGVGVDDTDTGSSVSVMM